MFWLGFGDWKNVVWEKEAGFADNGEEGHRQRHLKNAFCLKQNIKMHRFG